jgi:hypothetical protein
VPDATPRVIVSLGAAVALVGTFLPWLSSGSVGRSSYELFAVVDRLGFSPDGPVGWVLRAWPFVPLLLVASALAWWWRGSVPRLRRLAAALPLVSALHVGGTSLAILAAPDVELFRVRAGTWVTLAGAATMLIGVAVGLRPRRLGATAGTPLAS